MLSCAQGLLAAPAIGQAWGVSSPQTTHPCWWTLPAVKGNQGATMGTLLKILNPAETDYVDRRYQGSKESYFALIAKSSTLYIGNLAFITTEEQVWELFSLVGRVKRIHMGLDKVKRTPCGFCFVIYYRRADALAAIKYLNGTLLDGRLIRVDIDYGYEEDRKWGRGRSGGQVRDEYRLDYDTGRGGYGVQLYQMLHGVSSAAGMPMMGPMNTPMFFGSNQRAQPPAPPRGGSGAAAGGAGAAADGAEAGAGESQEAAAAEPSGAMMGDEEEEAGDTPAPKRRRLPAAEEAEENVQAEQPDELGEDGEQQQQQDAAMADAGGAADAGELVDYE